MRWAEGPPDAAYRARGLAAYAKQDRVRLTHQRDKGSNMGDDAAEVAEHEALCAAHGWSKSRFGIYGVTPCRSNRSSIRSG